MDTEIKKLNDIKIMVAFMRRNAIEMAYRAGKKGAHLGGALSSVEIIACLYGAVMRIDANNSAWLDRDYFISSKAHCVLALYTALAYVGFFSRDELLTFEENGSDLSGHPVMNIDRGIELSGGSLGMGLSQGVGIALGLKRYKKDNHVFVLLGDGECDEGSIWEAAMSAAHFSLDHLIVIVDKNCLQYDGCTDNVMGLGDLQEKFKSFGFETAVIDGHSTSDLIKVLIALKQSENGKPKLIIANTVKGKGISFMENNPSWHHGILSKEQYEMALCELEEAANENR